MTLRWGKSPKCWNTILIRKRRYSVNWAASKDMMSSPSITNEPAVGSIKREIQRTSGDFPLPESPITTKVSPVFTSKETSLTAMTCPVCD